MNSAFACLGAALAMAAAGSVARAEVQDCTEITALPAVIAQQGVHCLKADLSTTAASGNAITVNANNVIIEMNGYKLGGLGGGPTTVARGIYALDRQNVTIRNGAIRGFQYGIFLDASGAGKSGGHVVEDTRIEGARNGGVLIEGSNVIVRNNFVFNTGSVGQTSNAIGIQVFGGTDTAILGNVVTNVTSFVPSFAISTETVRAIIQDNKLSTPSGVYGIFANGSSDACVDNTILGFGTPLSGCSLSVGNVF